MARHRMTLCIRLGAWRRRRRAAHTARAVHREQLRVEADYQQRLVAWKHRRHQLVADGLLPDEAQAQTGPMPARPDLLPAPASVELRPARPRPRPVAVRSPLPDATPPTEAIPSSRWPQPYTFTPTRGDHP